MSEGLRTQSESGDSDQLRQAIAKIARKTQRASREFSLLSSERKNQILEAMADELESRRSKVQQENAIDLQAAQDAGLTPALCDRLHLNDKRYQAMVQGLREMIALDDPVGSQISSLQRPNGLIISKVRVPIGVIVIVYESRPNVTADAAGLCVKTSNAVILRGGREALRSNQAIAEALRDGGSRAGLPDGVIEFVSTTDRSAVRELVQLEDYVDLVIPRGGEGLIRAVSEMSRVPVLKHYKGVCHTYVDRSADLQMALDICENAKCQRPGVCNAMETLLVDQGIAESFLPELAKRLGARDVVLRGDEQVRSYIPSAEQASEDDWHAEYLDLVLAVRVVANTRVAVEHINTYGSGHTDAIVAESEEAQKSFTDGVDSGVVMVNASTRFNDGGEFGMGAEMGISTDKLHARGPVGPEELTTYKYIVRGQGQIRS